MGEKQVRFTKCLPVAQKRLLHTLYLSAPRPSLSADSPLASGLIISQIQGEYAARRQLPEDCCWFRLRLGTHSGDCHSTWIGALSFQRHFGKNEAETWAAAVANTGQLCIALLHFLEVIFYRNDIRVERFQFNTFKWSDFYSFVSPPYTDVWLLSFPTITSVAAKVFDWGHRSELTLWTKEKESLVGL